MISKEELEKLTVPQLREKLKSRKLPLSGTKAEIINRLFDNILAEETLLGKSEGHENADTSEFDLANVDVDEVLADEILLSPISKTNKHEKSESKNGEQSILASFNAIEKTETQTKPSIKPPQNLNTSNGNIIGKTLSPDKPMDATSASTESINAKDKTVAAPSYTIEEEKKMLERAKRFGLPCKTEKTSTTDEIIKKRALRFGPVDSEVSKKDQRAKRFGPTTNSNTPVNSSSSIEDDILAKRAKRFGPLNA